MNKEFEYFSEQFADLKILRFQVPGFEELSLKQKQLVYYLSQAASCGRDIYYDQNYKHNLTIRRTLEEIYKHYNGERSTGNYQKFETYLKRVWFSNGIHHHYSTDKFFPEFDQAYFKELAGNSPGANFPLKDGESVEDLINRLIPIIFDPGVDNKRVNQDESKGLVTGSAVNFYDKINLEEVTRYYEGIEDTADKTPVEYGLNTRLVKEDGQVKELTWRSGGVYSEAIDQIIHWLKLAKTVAENEKQAHTIQKLIEYYQTGDLEKWNEYNLSWVADKDSKVDFINGFIEVYNDPLGMKGTWESLVNFRDDVATERAKTISENAQWFEDHSPVEDRFKKKEVKGVSAKVITAAQLGGECYPSTPIGINLPNLNWIRKEHGSKSVTIGNIIHAHFSASLSDGFLEEFTYTEEELDLARKYGAMALDVHVDLHECLGHGSGQMLPGVSDNDLSNYHSVIEEARADLFALYFVMDQKMVDLGIIPSLDVARAEYNSYVRNGLMTQLTRVELGKNVEEAHMRNRQLIAKWCFEQGKGENVIEQKTKDGKTYFVVNDYEKLRALFGELLAEVQRIKSEGDLEAARQLVESYGVKVDQDLHEELLARYKKLELAPYSGFINPVFEPVEENGEIIDVKVIYPDDFAGQNLWYSEEYSFLPNYN